MWNERSSTVTWQCAAKENLKCYSLQNFTFFPCHKTYKIDKGLPQVSRADKPQLVKWGTSAWYRPDMLGDRHWRSSVHEHPCQSLSKMSWAQY